MCASDCLSWVEARVQFGEARGEIWARGSKQGEGNDSKKESVGWAWRRKRGGDVEGSGGESSFVAVSLSSPKHGHGQVCKDGVQDSPTSDNFRNDCKQWRLLHQKCCCEFK